MNGSRPESFLARARAALASPHPSAVVGGFLSFYPWLPVSLIYVVSPLGRPVALSATFAVVLAFTCRAFAVDRECAGSATVVAAPDVETLVVNGLQLPDLRALFGNHLCVASEPGGVNTGDFRPPGLPIPVRAEPVAESPRPVISYAPDVQAGAIGCPQPVDVVPRPSREDLGVGRLAQVAPPRSVWPCPRPVPAGAGVFDAIKPSRKHGSACVDGLGHDCYLAGGTR